MNKPVQYMLVSYIIMLR